MQVRADADGVSFTEVKGDNVKIEYGDSDMFKVEASEPQALQESEDDIKIEQVQMDASGF